MKEMTVAKLLKNKKDLEGKLNLIIREFETDTGIEVKNIYNLRKYIHSNLTGDIKVPDIHINLEL